MTALTSLQVTSVLSYVIAVLVPALDAVLPVLPSETAVIALGVATAFEDRPWAGFAVAFGVTVVVSGLVEVARRIGRSRQRSARPGPGQADRDHLEREQPPHTTGAPSRRSSSRRTGAGRAVRSVTTGRIGRGA